MVMFNKFNLEKSIGQRGAQTFNPLTNNFFVDEINLLFNQNIEMIRDTVHFVF